MRSGTGNGSNRLLTRMLRDGWDSCLRRQHASNGTSLIRWCHPANSFCSRLSIISSRLKHLSPRLSCRMRHDCAASASFVIVGCLIGGRRPNIILTCNVKAVAFEAQQGHPDACRQATTRPNYPRSITGNAEYGVTVRSQMSGSSDATLRR
jgi:hypothetical protein